MILSDTDGRWHGSSSPRELGINMACDCVIIVTIIWLLSIRTESGILGRILGCDDVKILHILMSGRIRTGS